MKRLFEGMVAHPVVTGIVFGLVLTPLGGLLAWGICHVLKK